MPAPAQADAPAKLSRPIVALQEVPRAPATVIRGSSPPGRAAFTGLMTEARLTASARSRLRRLPRRIGYLWAPRIASALRKRWVLLRNAHATVRFGKGVYLGPGFSLDIADAGSFIVGPGVEFRRGFRAEIAGRGRIVIGAGSAFTYDVLIQCSTTVEIGERSIFGQATAIFDGNHRFRDLTRPMVDQGFDFRPIKIGDDVMIPAKCTILADVGTRAVIGSNSVVTRPIPAYSVAVGAPARVIEYFGPEEQRPPEAEGAAGIAVPSSE